MSMFVAAVLIIVHVVIRCWMNEDRVSERLSECLSHWLTFLVLMNQDILGKRTSKNKRQPISICVLLCFCVSAFVIALSDLTWLI